MQRRTAGKDRPIEIMKKQFTSKAALQAQRNWRARNHEQAKLNSFNSRLKKQGIKPFTMLQYKEFIESAPKRKDGKINQRYTINYFNDLIARELSAEYECNAFYESGVQCIECKRKVIFNVGKFLICNNCKREYENG